MRRHRGVALCSNFDVYHIVALYESSIKMLGTGTPRLHFIEALINMTLTHQPSINRAKTVTLPRQE